MDTTIHIEGKPVAVSISAAALRALHQRQSPLIAEMELYFSCLLRLKVRFREQGDTTDLVEAGHGLWINFRPVMTATCGVDYVGDEPPLTDFPIQRSAAFVPHWLRIDFRRGEWQGAFGYRTAT